MVRASAVANRLDLSAVSGGCPMPRSVVTDSAASRSINRNRGVVTVPSCPQLAWTGHLGVGAMPFYALGRKSAAPSAGRVANESDALREADRRIKLPEQEDEVRRVGPRLVSGSVECAGPGKG